MNRKTQYVHQNVDIREHKAPTDESIRLLNEFQEKAKQNIIATFPTQDNTINAMAIFYHNEMIYRRVDYQLKFSLNGREIICEGYLDRNNFSEEIYKTFHHYLQEAVKEILIKRFSEIIAQRFVEFFPKEINGMLKIQP